MSIEDESKMYSVDQLKLREELSYMKTEEEKFQLDSKDYLAISIAALQTIFLPIVILMAVIAVVGITVSFFLRTM